MKTSKFFSGRSRLSFLSTGILLYFFVLFIWLRGNAIASRSLFNPDEAELLADGIRASKSLIPFKDFTSPTFGPIWPLFLGYLHRFGLPLNLPIAHLLSALILILICKFVFHSSTRRFSIPISIFIVTPLALQLATGLGNFDYLSLSTELLPLLFLITATYITYRRTLTGRAVVVIGLLFGLAVFSKYFFAPLALVGMVMTFSKACSDGLRWAPVLRRIILGFCTPIALLTFWALLAGVPLWKIIESPIMTLEYFQGGGLGDSACTSLTRINNIRSSISSHFASLSLLLLGISLFLSSSISLRSRHQMSNMVLLFLPPVTALFLLSRSCTIFPHYNYLLVGGFLQSFIASTSFSKPQEIQKQRSERRIVMFLFSLVLMQIVFTNVTHAITSPLTNGPEKIRHIFSTTNGLWERAWDEKQVPLSSYCKRDDSVLVWGWSPDLYSFYDWEPASRYVTTTLMMERQMFAHDTLKFRGRLKDDLNPRNLDCVVVAVGPSFFGGFNETDSMKAQMPDLWRRLVKQMDEKIFYWDSVNPVTVLVPRQR